MAVRITKEGLQSYDPLAEFRKKKKKKTTVAAPEPEPKPISKPAPRLATEEERFELAAGRAKAAGIKPPILTPEGQFVYPEEPPTIEELAMAKEVGKLGPSKPIFKDILDIEQAKKSALAATVGGVAGGTAVGLIAGAGVASIPLAVLGGVAGFINAYKSNLKTQRKDMLSGEATNLEKISSNLIKLVRNTNAGSKPSKMLELFNAQLSIIDESHSRLKMETSDDLSKWLGEDGKQQLEKFETFYSRGGLREILIIAMQDAILNPDPNKILADLESFEIEE